MGWVNSWKTLKPDPVYCSRCHDAIGHEWDPVYEEWDAIPHWKSIYVPDTLFCSLGCRKITFNEWLDEGLRRAHARNADN